MKTFKQLITARRISLGLILVITGLMYLSTLIPQEIDSSPGKIEAWRQGHGSLLWLIDGIKLHRIYAQPWFAAAILFAALALGVSSCDQLAAARRKMRSTGVAAGEKIADSIPEQHLRSVAGTYRYRLIQTDTDGQLKFVRYPWGYFGSLLLHLGMTLVITVSFYVSLTGRQGVLILTEGEQRNRLQAWDATEYGLLASPLKLPGAVRLDQLRVDFDEKNQPAGVTSLISFTHETGRVDTLEASINRISRYQGLRIYHTASYGAAFRVTFLDRNGVPHEEKLLVQQAPNLTKAGYSDDFAVTWSPHLFSAKYFPDANYTSMQSANPLLVVRYLDREKEVARTALTAGSSAILGEYQVRFDGTERWAKLIVVDISGMPLIFAGFAVIMLGGLVHYMAPPRELIAVRQHDGSFHVYWRAPSFRDFFTDERDEVAGSLRKGAVC